MAKTDVQSKRSHKAKDAPRPIAIAPINDPTFGGGYFPSVKKARAALMAKGLEIVEKYLWMIDMATAGGDYETANKAFQFLIEHMPKEDGETIIAESAAKPKMVESGPRGPFIQIGVKVGGTEHKALPDPVTIDVIPNE